MSLADIIARKKAAAEAASKPTKVEAVEQQVAAQEITNAQATAAISEEVAKPVEKPLTFAEKMALKRAQAAAAPTLSDPVTATSTTETELPNVVAPVTEPAQPASSSVELPAPIPALPDTGKQKDKQAQQDRINEADPATAQAYADIADRLRTLEDLSESDLKNAMSELKTALLANPNAVSLMEDTDYAQMVIALRRLTKEDQVEAAKEKTTGGRKKKPTLDLSDPAAVEAAFAEF